MIPVMQPAEPLRRYHGRIIIETDLITVDYPAVATEEIVRILVILVACREKPDSPIP